MPVDLMPSLFKYPGQTAPVKIGSVNTRVRPAKPAKREKGKGRTVERTRDGKISVAREGRRERKDEEIEGEGERERREREEREGREEDFPPPASSHDESNFRREETRGERRGKMSWERERKRKKKECEREEEEKWRKREIKKESEGERETREKREEKRNREGDAAPHHLN